MCGRFFLLASPGELADLFQLADVTDLAPRYNIAPTQPVAVVRHADQARELVRLRWGLIPPWSRDGKVAPINARSETAADKPTFRAAFRKRRCLIPASGFYEWVQTGAKKKQPFCIRLADDKPFAFAGLWERWEGAAGPVDSCAILTTEANALVRPVHDRMPVILDPRHFDRWLDPTEEDAGALAPLLRPFAADRMRAYPVSPQVNSPETTSLLSGAGRERRRCRRRGLPARRRDRLEVALVIGPGGVAGAAGLTHPARKRLSRGRPAAAAGSATSWTYHQPFASQLM